MCGRRKASCREYAYTAVFLGDEPLLAESFSFLNSREKLDRILDHFVLSLSAEHSATKQHKHYTCQISQWAYSKLRMEDTMRQADSRHVIQTWDQSQRCCNIGNESKLPGSVPGCNINVYSVLLPSNYALQCCFVDVEFLVFLNCLYEDIKQLSHSSQCNCYAVIHLADLILNPKSLMLTPQHGGCKRSCILWHCVTMTMIPMQVHVITLTEPKCWCQPVILKSRYE